jgi:hypothetical protein
MGMEQWWSDDLQGKAKFAETCPSATLSTRNPIWTTLGFNSDIRSDRPELCHSPSNWLVINRWRNGLVVSKGYLKMRWLQCPRILRHVPSSLARKLGSWVDVCVRLFCVCVVLCVGSGLATGSSPVQGGLPILYRIKKLKKRPKSNKGL